MENSTSLSIGVCLQDEKRVQTLLDPHRSLTEIVQKDLSTIKEYISGGQGFEEFCEEG